ncbi:hypothetical protein ACEZSR_004075 [Vibrio parahaemolyticus]|uniref:hypothetical protein n=1 Tax=Vibrio alginolyticus TaxID=663 RepID=UPI000AFAF4CD|nr:hypothetical protein [Vibrio alginolyticus]ELJ1804434.1 hypothetical protein [Vibrio parahaemolyticus]MBS9810607.1 hypothetical protein [Vibrio alginolyticus]
MNLIDLVVTRVASKPRQEFGLWLVDVEAIAYGRCSEHTLMFKTKDEADSVKPGHVFQG